jgi:selenocysteine lyase/cysteine desulfurase
MEQVGIARRDFLKGIAAAALTAGFISPSEAKAFMDRPGKGCGQNILPQTLQPHPVIKEDVGTEQFWAKVRQTFVLPDDYIHMNTGTTGSQPLFSLVNLGVYNLYKCMDPRDWETNLNADYPKLFPVSTSILGTSGLASRQAAVAAQYGANDDEIVLSYNTTDACNLIFAGTPWNPGDRIISTSWEHPALEGPIAWAHDYHGVDVELVGLPSNFTPDITVADILALFENKLKKHMGSKKKQYLAFSEIFYKNGLRMPVAELCALARSYGAYSIVDSAHGWGQLPIDCHAYGADFIAGAGHKWLCGGPGTGIFYVRNSGDKLPPFAMGDFFLYANGDLPNKTSPNFNVRPWTLGGPSLYVQLRGEANTPALYAMSDSAAYFGSLGVRNIYSRGVALGKYLKKKIVHQWGPNALWVNPGDHSFFTALTSFNPFAGKDDSSQYDTLNTAMTGILNTLAAEDPKIYLRTTQWHDKPDDAADNRVGFRVSTHGVYNNYQQIDYMFHRLVKAVNDTSIPQL